MTDLLIEEQHFDSKIRAKQKTVIRLVDEQPSEITHKEEVDRQIPEVLKGDKTLYEAELKQVYAGN